MSDYIKREDVINAVCGDCPYNCSELRKEKHPCMEYKELMKIPSADVAPIVRCKDCKWWDECDELDKNGYCHHGERKDDNSL